MMFANFSTFNGFDDYELYREKHYATGSEFLIEFKGSSISSTANIKFHYEDENGTETKTNNCTQTGSMSTLASCRATSTQILE